MINISDKELEEVKEKICDHYCRFPFLRTQEELINDYCNSCPLDKLGEKDD